MHSEHSSCLLKCPFLLSRHVHLVHHDPLLLLEHLLHLKVLLDRQFLARHVQLLDHTSQHYIFLLVLLLHLFLLSVRMVQHHLFPPLNPAPPAGPISPITPFGPCGPINPASPVAPRLPRISLSPLIDAELHPLALLTFFQYAG